MSEDKNYQPELGQGIFGQPFQKIRGSNLLEAALDAIRHELDRVMWNLHQEEYPSPFINSGNVPGYKDEVFEVHAYDWNEDHEQAFNFKWKDVEVSWYKHCGRGLSVNQELTANRIEEMLDECLKSIRDKDKE